MIQVNSIYETDPCWKNSQAAKEHKRVNVVEFIDEDNKHLFAFGNQPKLKETFSRTIGKKMIKLPFGFTVFY